MPRYLSALILGLFVTAAIAGDDGSVKRPYVEVGDCWTYRVTVNGTVSHHDLCVTYVNQEKDVIIAERTSKRREILETFTTEWNPLQDARHVRKSKTRFLQFPLHVGDTYSFVGDYLLLDRPEVEREVHWNIKVVGWDEVTVPAGTFRAMRIEGNATRTHVSRSGRLLSPTQSQVTMWYVPEVNREVKSIWVNYSRTTVRELTKYRLNK